jgi:hypothetical protein
VPEQAVRASALAPTTSAVIVLRLVWCIVRETL